MCERSCEKLHECAHKGRLHVYFCVCMCIQICVNECIWAWRVNTNGCEFTDFFTIPPVNTHTFLHKSTSVIASVFVKYDCMHYVGVHMCVFERVDARVSVYF